MKKFNQVISIEVSVDAIAAHLLSTFAQSFPHAEMLTETIVSVALDHGTIGNIYNNLNGYTNDIDFQVGQVVNPIGEETYTHINESETEEPVWKEKRIPVTNAEIVEINPNRKGDKVKIQFWNINRIGVRTSQTTWVSHHKLELAQEKPENLVQH